MPKPVSACRGTKNAACRSCQWHTENPVAEDQGRRSARSRKNCVATQTATAPPPPPNAHRLYRRPPKKIRRRFSGPVRMKVIGTVAGRSIDQLAVPHRTVTRTTATASDHSNMGARTNRTRRRLRLTGSSYPDKSSISRRGRVGSSAVDRHARGGVNTATRGDNTTIGASVRTACLWLTADPADNWGSGTPRGDQLCSR